MDASCLSHEHDFSLDDFTLPHPGNPSLSISLSQCYIAAGATRPRLETASAEPENEQAHVPSDGIDGPKRNIS